MRPLVLFFLLVPRRGRSVSKNSKGPNSVGCQARPLPGWEEVQWREQAVCKGKPDDSLVPVFRPVNQSQEQQLSHQDRREPSSKQAQEN